MSKIFSFSNLKKINIILLCFLSLLFSACTLDTEAPKSDKLNVLTVIFPQYDFVREIAGDMADISMITPPGGEVHGYEPSLSDIIAIREADVFIYNGGESDVWIERILSSVDISEKIVVALMDSPGIKLYREEHINTLHEHDGIEHSHEHTQGREGASYDEHIWTSPKNSIAIADVIAGALGRADKSNAAKYIENAKSFKAELAKLDSQLTAAVENASGNFIAFADRFPFLYLAKDYSIDYMAAFSGCSPEGDAGPRLIAAMIDEIEHHSLDSVFYIELSNQKMADAICEHTGAKKLLLHSCQSISKADFESGIGYIDLMRQNIENLKEALE